MWYSAISYSALETIGEVISGFAVVSVALVFMGLFLWRLRHALLQDEKRSERASDPDRNKTGVHHAPKTP